MASIDNRTADFLDTLLDLEWAEAEMELDDILRRQEVSVSLEPQVEDEVLQLIDTESMGW